MNQWGRQPVGKDSRTLVFGIIIIGIIGYLLLPNFFKTINSSLDPTVTGTSLNNDNRPSTYDPNAPNALDSSSSPSQLFPSANNTVNSGSGNNAISSGYWVIYVSNGTSQQLSINAQDYTFVHGLIQSDSKGTGTTTVFLVDNGQIHQYHASNETFAIISNIATINARNSNTSTPSTTTPSTSTPSTTTPSTTAPSTTAPSTTAPPTTTPSTTTPSTTISETLIVSKPSTSGFTVALNPALNGLSISNFTLVNSSGNSVALTGAKTSDNGATYAISAELSAGQTYTLTAADTGYTFGTAQNVVVP